LASPLIYSSRLNHNKNVLSIEKQIADERSRGQASIDDVRKQLKSKILVLEASIEDIQKSGLDANREIRRLEKNLKTVWFLDIICLSFTTHNKGC
jgi:hypothetical protein